MKKRRKVERKYKEYKDRMIFFELAHATREMVPRKEAGLNDMVNQRQVFKDLENDQVSSGFRRMRYLRGSAICSISRVFAAAQLRRSPMCRARISGQIACGGDGDEEGAPKTSARLISVV